MDFLKDEREPNQTSAMQHSTHSSPIPSLTTKETARLREDYPAIEYLEAGKIGAWLVERQDQLLIRAKTTRAEMNLAKLIALAGTAIGAVCYATSPLAPIGTVVAGVGYVWAVAQDLNDSHQFAPIPFLRGNVLEFLSAMGDVEAREDWLSHQNELVDLMNHLEPLERYEFVMLRQYTNTLVEFLSGVDPGKCFYAYRWLLNGYITLRGGFPTVGQLQEHLAKVTVDPRVNFQHVETLQQPQHSLLDPRLAELPQARVEALPSPPFRELPEPFTAKPADISKPPGLAQPPNLPKLLSLSLDQRALALIDALQTSGFDLAKCIKDQITIICGNQRGGKGTLMAILAILSKALEPTTRIHYFTAGDDIYPFHCDRLVCRLSYSNLDGADADAKVAGELYRYLKAMDNATQGIYQDIILVIDEAVALSDYLDDGQKQWMIRFLLTRANKKGAQIFVVLHGKNLSSWVGSKNTEGFSSTFKTGVTFVGCEATSKKVSPLKSISVATGRYFLTDPDSFEKAVKGGEIGTLPDWLKTETNPATGQPDPARTLLRFFPELAVVPPTGTGEERQTVLKQNLEKLLELEAPESDRPTAAGEPPTPPLSAVAQKVIQAVKELIGDSLNHYTSAHFIAAREIYRHDRTLNAQETKDAIEEIVRARMGESQDGSNIRLLKA